LTSPCWNGSGNRHRAVDEVGIRGEQLDGDAFLRESAKRQRRFQRGDAPSGDQDVERLRHTPETFPRAAMAHSRRTLIPVARFSTMPRSQTPYRQ
jgi:hypothetical protein